MPRLIVSVAVSMTLVTTATHVLATSFTGYAPRVHGRDIRYEPGFSTVNSFHFYDASRAAWFRSRTGHARASRALGYRTRHYSPEFP